MLDPAIESFLTERREAWLKKKLKPSQSESEQAELQTEATLQFALANWLPDAAKRAKQLNVVSHPAKFSHSAAQTSSVIAQTEYRNDGLLRYGNVTDIGLDVFGNAAAMDVYKFVSLSLQDGLTILQHLEQKTDVIQQQFDLPTASFDELHSGLMAMKQDNDPQTSTSGKVKQVYFPVESAENGYHLLSILTSSGLMYELKQRMNKMRFSDDTKQAREDRKSGEFNPNGLREIYGLTGIGFGGTKPQNISALNNQNGGVAYLLKSMPPEILKRDIRLPKRDFFNEVLWTKAFDWAFKQLDYLLNKDWRNTFEIRNQRDDVFQEAIYQAAELVWRIREISPGWSEFDTYENLPAWQIYWLDQLYENQRKEEDEYLDLAMKGFSHWFLNAFEAYLKVNKRLFDDAELKHFMGLGEGFNPETEQQFKEAFR